MSDSDSAGPSTSFGPLRLESGADGVALVSIDVPGHRLNVLQASFIDDLDRLLDQVEHEEEYRAVVLASGKLDHFVAGADLRVLESLRFASEGAEMAHLGHAVMDRVAGFSRPVVAAIHGRCLGGGLELALACQGRVASSHPLTRLGLPEVRLGLLPGLGGTQRLPRLVGLPAALKMMLSGKEVDAAHAKRIGLVDELVAKPILLDVAAELALRLARGSAPRRRRTLHGFFGMRDASKLRAGDNLLARSAVLSRARRRVLAQTRGNYPAPERILDVVREGMSHGMRRGLEAEAKAFGELVTSPQAAQLIRLFFLQRELRKDTGVSEARVETRPVSSVGIIGAGVMGAGIAYVTAQRAALGVRMLDSDAASLGRGLRTIRDLADRRVEQLRMSPVERDALLSRISPTLDHVGFDHCEVVIEAVPEELGSKRRIAQQVAATCPPQTIIASNTSSLPISRIADAVDAPERVVGLHYFSPVHRMPLLEVVATEKTAPWVIATCVELGKRQGKTPIVVRDGVGMYATRILAPYLSEAAYLFAEGVPIERIDNALVDWGFPVGPIALLDEIGIDVAQKVTGVLREAFGERLAPPQSLERLTQDGRLGRKNGRGFYVHGGGRSKVDAAVYRLVGVRPRTQLPAGEIVQRCALRMVNEAVMCHAENVVRCPRDADVGAIFGLGFPPFRGGPLRYVDEVGAEEIVRRLRNLEQQLGSRFAPAPSLVAMASAGRTFHAGDANHAAATGIGA